MLDKKRYVMYTYHALGLQSKRLINKSPRSYGLVSIAILCLFEHEYQLSIISYI